MEFQDINFPPNTTDKLQPKVQKHLDKMEIDAVQPKIEQDLYIEDDFDSFMIVNDGKKVKVGEVNTMKRREAIMDKINKQLPPNNDTYYIEHNRTTVV